MPTSTATRAPTWGDIGASPNPTSGTYRGAGPFSEPAIKNMRYLLTHHPVSIYNANHTYGEFVLRGPSNANEPTPPDEDQWAAPNRDAYMVALEAAADPDTHSVLEVEAPAGAELQLRKRFTMYTAPVLQPDGSRGNILPVPPTSRSPTPSPALDPTAGCCSGSGSPSPAASR